jgi:Domain of unknown function (DUF3387)
VSYFAASQSGALLTAINRARRIPSLFAVCVPAEETMAIREDVAFSEAAVRASIAKIEGADREGADVNAELEMAVKQVSTRAGADACAGAAARPAAGWLLSSRDSAMTAAPARGW